MANSILADSVGQTIHHTHTLQLGALPLLYPLLEQLGLRDLVNQLCPSEAEVDVGRIVVLLVLNRLLAPQPLCWVSRWLGQSVLSRGLDLPVQQVYDTRLGRALDTIHPQLGEIWAQLVGRAIRQWNLDLSVLHWDITSFYFQGAYTDSELIRYGYTRDHQPETKQINLQADVTHQSQVPIDYRVLAGSTADITTPQGHLTGLLRFLARPELADLHVRPILVSDCKMITPEAVAGCHHHDLFYLGPWARNAAVLTVLHSVSEAELAEQVLAYRPQRQALRADWIPYRGVWRPFTIQVPPPPDSPGAAAEAFTDRVLVLWSAGKARLDQQKRRTSLKRLLDNLEHIRRQLNTRRYAERDYVVEQIAQARRGNPAKPLVACDLQGTDHALHFQFHLDRDRLAQEQAVEGRYVLGTNAASLSANDALSLFKGQDRVEKQFRTVKGPLEIRPVFLHHDARIEGVVFLTLVALLVRALLRWRCRQVGLAQSVDRLFAEFAPWSVVELTLTDGTPLRQVARPTDFQAQTLAALGVSDYERYLSSLLASH